MADDGTTPAADPAAGFQNLLAQHKQDALQVASKLYDENFNLRSRNRDLSEKLPKDGSLVLSADDAKEWEAFKALSMPAKDVKKAVERVPELEKQNRELGSMETLRELADVGLDGSKLKLSVLKDQLSAKYPDAKITFQEEEKDGQKAKVAYIQRSDKEPVQKFSEFAAAELGDYLPALKVSPEANTQVPPGNTQDPKPLSGSSSVFDRIRDEEKKASEGTKPIDLDARFGRSQAAIA